MFAMLGTLVIDATLVLVEMLASMGSDVAGVAASPVARFHDHAHDRVAAGHDGPALGEVDGFDRCR